MEKQFLMTSMRRYHNSSAGYGNRRPLFPVLLIAIFALLLSGFLSADTPTGILFLGDSLTEGYGISPENAYPELVRQALTKKGHPVTTLNAGISGSTSAGALFRLKQHLKKKSYDVLLLALGANDGLRGLPVKALRQNLLNTIAFAKERDMKVVLAGMLIPMNYGKRYRNAFRDVYREIAAADRDLHFIPFLLEGVAARDELNISDGIHPNEAGHKVIARLVTDHLIRCCFSK